MFSSWEWVWDIDIVYQQQYSKTCSSYHLLRNCNRIESYNTFLFGYLMKTKTAYLVMLACHACMSCYSWLLFSGFSIPFCSCLLLVVSCFVFQWTIMNQWSINNDDDSSFNGQWQCNQWLVSIVSAIHEERSLYDQSMIRQQCLILINWQCLICHPWVKHAQYVTSVIHLFSIQKSNVTHENDHKYDYDCWQSKKSNSIVFLFSKTRKRSSVESME